MTISRPVENRALGSIESVRQKKLRSLQDAIKLKLDEARQRTPGSVKHEVRVDYDPDLIRLDEVSEVLSRFDSEYAVSWRTEQKAIKVVFR